jgi:hypothetical protein
MNSHARNTVGKLGFVVETLRIAAFVLILCAAAGKSYAQGRVEDEVRRNNEAKKDIARREEAATRARNEFARTEKLNETKSRNSMEALNKETTLNKPEIRARDQAKLRSASETLKKSGAKEAAEGGKKPPEVGNPTSGGATQARARNPGKTK